MAGDTGLVLGIVGLGLGGFYLWQKNKQSSPPPPSPTTSAPPQPAGYQAPDDLLNPMEAAWYLYGSPTDQAKWVQAMQTVQQESAGAWTYVWQNWLPVYNNQHGWPSNDQLREWLTYGVQQGF